MAKKSVGTLMERLRKEVAEKETRGTREDQDKKSLFDERRIALSPHYQKQGSVETKILLKVPPEKCRMWERHNRQYQLLNEGRCADLIESFRAQGQQLPAIARELVGEEEHQYEVICGARRHWVAKHLGMPLLIEVRQLTDKEAFLLSDAENRAREDISDYERAIEYHAALKAFYSTQNQMAAAMEVSVSWLNDYLALAKLPTEIVEAYDNILDLKVTHASKLRPFLAKRVSREAIIDKARELKGRGLPGPSVFKELLKAAREENKKGRGGNRLLEIRTASGVIGKITVPRRGARKIEISSDVKELTPELEEAFIKALRESFQ